MKHLNTYFEFPAVKFESLAILKFAPSNASSAISIDISDAYHHLRIHEKLEQFFQFKIDGVFYIARGLPFGWAPAPGIFTKFIKEVLNVIRRPHIIGGTDWIIKNTYK